MLALMMVMGVTFSIFMRTERLAAGHFRADVQTRELLQVALARALDEIDVSVGTAVYPSWDILQSSGTGDVNTAALSGAVSNWIPWAVISATNPAPRWNNLTSGGRFSYLVLNCSGLVDVNYAGGSSRGCGTNVSEIQLSALSEVADATALVNGRPYETLQDLGFKAGAALSGPSQHLMTYSAFPTNYVGGTDLHLEDLSGDINALKVPARKQAIIDAFTRSGITDATFAYNNLLSYVDPLVTPLNPDDLGTPMTKLVPMINEVRIAMTNLIVAGGKCMPKVTVDVELFYPFLKDSPAGPYKVNCDVSVLGVGTDPKYVPTIKAPMLTTYNGRSATPYQSAQFTVIAPAVAIVTNDPIQLAVTVGAQVTQAGTTVDSVPYPYVSAQYFSVTGGLMNVVLNHNGGVRGYECYDPRFNWDTTIGGQQWVKYALEPNGTINRTNWAMGFYRNLYKARVNEYTEMYVAGGPLHNVGELSYLLRGAQKTDKWSTIKICLDQRTIPAGVDRVLDNFTVQVSTNRRGLVNLNSHNAEALASVFSGMPLERYPGDPSAVGSSVSPAQATLLATELINQTATPISLMSNYGSKTNLMAVIGGLSPLRAQSIIRNSAGLFHFRQNLFVVLLYAQPSQGSNDKAGLRAVAEVWRDPLANAGTHPRFVRSFKIISD
jgi:hypothetical protein